jgi:hypothetical protein
MFLDSEFDKHILNWTPYNLFIDNDDIERSFRKKFFLP